jgi:hypothetical protein
MLRGSIATNRVETNDSATGSRLSAGMTGDGLVRAAKEIEMGTRRIVGALATGALVASLWACGSSTASSPSAAAGNQPSQAPASAAEPSVAEPSQAEPSQAEASLAVPSFVLPSGAKDLEALLPDQLCGAKAVKLSMTGDQFASSANTEFKAALQALGKSVSDVAFAIAGDPTYSCTAGIFRVKGVDQNLLQQALLAEEQKSGNTYTQGSVGGKNVYITDAGSGKQYVYFSGDAAIFASAKTEAEAAGILQKLP